MKRLIWTPKFQKASKKLLNKNPELTEIFKQKIIQIEENPFNPILKTHKLRGNLKGFYSCSINYIYRIVFELTIDLNTKEEIIVLLNIGSHDEVY